MYFSISFIAISIVLVTTSAQFPQYPPQFSDLQQPFSAPQPPFSPFRTGGYQLRSPPPPRFNPFEHVYNEKGEKLSCKMVCSPSDETEDIDERRVPEKKDSDENKLEKKEE